MKINDVMQPSKNVFNITKEKNQQDFSTFLKDSLKKVNDYELDSERINTLAAVGEIDNIHEVMIAAEKSKIALQFTVEVKNKVLDAYKQIMRLQV
ncbi:flagellar hook-basal body complex protein FliE [Crassaminicella profunda]|uniref:flagellar hook-basal body complex protein FliE n=1 Tax=Crassaminicella profunda TaxID=1286698 RepID=UPI001CA783A3|nr:flagellar hook-basal body complex protein FliE [Crassaminicella profunda]QZY56745.1 flagellar hook-basal body complex protein FliE [Crassaminicella profunda]